MFSFRARFKTGIVEDLQILIDCITGVNDGAAVALVDRAPGLCVGSSIISGVKKAIQSFSIIC